MRRVTIELHTKPGPHHDEGREYDLTPWVTRVSWSEAVAPPWGHINFGLKPYGAPVTPHPGDWVVIRPSPGAPAITFGEVTAPALPVAVGDNKAVMLGEDDYQADVWLQCLARALIYLSHDPATSVGTFFSPDQRWALAQAATSWFDGDLGPCLEKLFRLVAYVPMPPTLGGVYYETTRVEDWGPNTGPTLAPPKTVNDPRYDIPRQKQEIVIGEEKINVTVHAVDVHLSNSTGIIWHEESAAALSAPGKGERSGAPRKDAERVPGLAMPDVQTLFGAQGVSALDLIQGTFGADPNLVEMFGVLEDFDNVGDYAPPSMILAKKLGRLPVLVFRMRPWRSRPVVTAVRVAGESNAGLSVPPGLFERMTWRGSNPQDATGAILTGRLSQSINQAFNAATANLGWAPALPIGHFRHGQLPVYDPKEVARDGARLYEVPWKFLPPPADVSTVADSAQERNAEGYNFKLRGVAPTVIMLHDTGGWSLDGALATFKANGTSTNYLIKEDGQIVTLAVPDPGTVSEGRHAGGWNQVAIGIDMVGQPWPIFSPNVFTERDKERSPGVVVGAPTKYLLDRAGRRIQTERAWALGKTFAPATKDIVDYTDAQKSALVSLVSQLCATYGIPRRVLGQDLNWRFHSASALGALPSSYRGVICHAQVDGTDHSDGFRAIELLASAGFETWVNPYGNLTP